MVSHAGYHSALQAHDAMARAPGQVSMNDFPEDSELEQDVRGNLLCPDGKSCLLSLLALPVWMSGLKIIEQKHHAVVFVWGSYVGTLVDPGCHCVNPCGTTLKNVSTAKKTIDIKDIKVADSMGNPVCVSGNVAYQVYSAKKALVDVENVFQFVSQQAPMVLRRISSKYPYDKGSGPCLCGRDGDETVSEDLRRTMQEQVSEVGVQVLQFEITDISYAPEIAAAMLRKQQAEAMIEARQALVQSAVDISSTAIRRMKDLGHQMTTKGEERIVKNLLAVMCSDKSVQPTIPMF
eukprot:TRINITY_DN41098_c0_g1_i1.p1 TRINITY_DN41098_c0_g1~~TRINITY_DN41098_c0_g1_i1.p1  ORF type:complete len:292 (-),score=54.24 TRINITY_DN41098_c0_g1_i1:347-1222(-)